MHSKFALVGGGGGRGGGRGVVGGGRVRPGGARAARRPPRPRGGADWLVCIMADIVAGWARGAPERGEKPAQPPSRTHG